MPIQAAPPVTPAATVHGHFALDRERWDAVDAIAFPVAGKPQTWLVFSNKPFNRTALAAAGALSRGAVQAHQRSQEAVTLSLLMDAQGQLLAADYGRGGAELDSPLDFNAALKLSRLDAQGIAGTLRHAWLDLDFDVPVVARIEVNSAVAELDHPAALSLQRMLTALYADDVETWVALAQPAGYNRSEHDLQDMHMARQVLPQLRRIEAVRIDGNQAQVDFSGSKGDATAVMGLEDGRWMLQQISPR